MTNTDNGSKLYLYSITSVAILGGLLFGYDTAVISGAEKGLEAFFLTATDFQYDKVMHGITSSSALIGCVLGGALSGIFASRLGRRNSLRLAAVLFFLSALGSYYPEFLFFEYGKADMNLLIAFNLNPRRITNNQIKPATLCKQVRKFKLPMHELVLFCNLCG